MRRALPRSICVHRRRVGGCGPPTSRPWQNCFFCRTSLEVPGAAMDFDLRKLDKQHDKSKPAPAKTSKFAPRLLAKARARAATGPAAA